MYVFDKAFGEYPVPRPAQPDRRFEQSAFAVLFLPLAAAWTLVASAITHNAVAAYGTLALGLALSLLVLGALSRR